MTIRDLIAELQKRDPEDDVFVDVGEDHAEILSVSHWQDPNFEDIHYTILVI